MDEIANLEFESMSKEEIYDLYKLGRIQCETKRKLYKQRLIDAVKAKRKSYIGALSEDWNEGYDDAIDGVLDVINETLPDP